MTEQRVELQKQQEELKEKLQDVERAIALNGLEQVITRLTQPEGIVLPETVSIKQLRKISKATQRIITLLESADLLDQTKELPLANDAVLEQEISNDPVFAEVEIPIQPSVEEVADTLEHIETPYDISEKGEQWLQSIFGDEWQTTLSITEQTTSRDIAEYMLARVIVKKPNTPEKVITRIVGRLQGKTMSEIADDLNEPKINTNAALGYIKKRFINTENTAPSSQMPTKVPLIEKQDDIEPIAEQPITIFEPAIVVLNESIHVESETEADTPEQETRETVAELITRRFNLEGVERVALVSLLNLKMRNDFTAPKVKLTEKLRPYVREWFDTPGHKSSDVAVDKILRKTFGVYTMQGTPQDRPVSSLQEAYKNASNSNNAAQLAEAIDATLYAIFNDKVVEEVESSEPEHNEVESISSATVHDAYVGVFDALVSNEALEKSEYSSISKFLNHAKSEGIDLEKASELLLQFTPTVRRRMIENEGIKSGSDQIDSMIKQYLFEAQKSIPLHAYAKTFAENGDFNETQVQYWVLNGVQSLYRAA